MAEETLIHMLGNIGVPAALCFYTLFEVNKNLKRLADSITHFGSEVDRRIDRVEADLRTLTIEVKALIKKEGAT